jgi:hypothetical protein
MTNVRLRMMFAMDIGHVRAFYQDRRAIRCSTDLTLTFSPTRRAPSFAASDNSVVVAQVDEGGESDVLRPCELRAESAAAPDGHDALAPAAEDTGGGENLIHGDFRLGQESDCVAAGALFQEIDDALEAEGEAAGGHVPVQGTADELVVTAPSGDGAAHLWVADLEDLPGVLAHGPYQGAVELPADRAVRGEPV